MNEMCKFLIQELRELRAGGNRAVLRNFTRGILGLPGSEIYTSE